MYWVLSPVVIMSVEISFLPHPPLHPQLYHRPIHHQLKLLLKEIDFFPEQFSPDFSLSLPYVLGEGTPPEQRWLVRGSSFLTSSGGQSIMTKMPRDGFWQPQITTASGSNRRAADSKEEPTSQGIFSGSRHSDCSAASWEVWCQESHQGQGCR